MVEADVAPEGTDEGGHPSPGLLTGPPPDALLARALHHTPRGEAEVESSNYRSDEMKPTCTHTTQPVGGTRPFGKSPGSFHE